MAFPHALASECLKKCATAHHDLKLMSTSKEGRTIYNYTSVSPNNSVTDHCRGLILDDHDWSIIAACMPRFYSLFERAATDAPIDRTIRYRAVDKLDGTYLQLYRFRGKVYVSTRGAVDGGNWPNGDTVRQDVVHALGLSDDDNDNDAFERLFAQVFDHFQLHTLWLEFTSPNNRLVTLYKDNRVWLLGGYLVSGAQLDQSVQQQIVEYLSNRGCFMHVPASRMASLDELDTLIQESNHSAGGPVIEGFVVHVGESNQLSIKYKNPKWVGMHVTTQHLTAEKVLSNVLYRRGDVVELLGVMPTMIETYQPIVDAVDHVNHRLKQLWMMCRELQNPLDKYRAATTQIDGVPLFSWYSHLGVHDEPPDFAMVLRHNPHATMKRRVTLIQQFGLLPPPPVETKIPDEWTVFGCRDSTDVDIFIFVRQPEHLQKTYDPSFFGALFPGRSIDINVGLIRESNGQWFVKQTTKGTAVQSHNIVFSTAQSPTPLTCLVEQNVDDMVRGVTTHVVRFMQHLISAEDYAGERRNRAIMFSAEKVRYAIRVLRMVVTFQDTIEWSSEIKSLTMKLLQLALYRLDRTEVYHKADLARVGAEKLQLSEEGLLWLLFRGTRGCSHAGMDALQLLVDHYEEIVNSSTQPELQWSAFPLGNYPTTVGRLDPSLFKLFMDNPVECTAHFATRFHLLHGESHDTLYQIFRCDNSHAELIPTSLRALHVDVSQGSFEWMQLQQRYNAQSVDKIASAAAAADHPLGFAGGYYNVIRGHVIEALASDAIREDGYYALHLGMLVDDDTGEAISPDSVLVSHDRSKVIVYEIKGVYGARHSAPYRRAVWLATRQLARAARMIRKTGLEVTSRLVLVYASSTGLLAEQTELKE